MSARIKKQLRSLKHGEINPRKEWVESNRAVLLSQIKNTIPSSAEYTAVHNFSSSFSHVFQTVFSFKIVKPLIAVLVAAVALPGAWIASGFASTDSLPGDTLYSAKMAAEKSQIVFANLVGDKTKEVQLHLSFAQRRALEVQKVANDPIRNSELAQTVNNLKDELSIASQKLVDIKNQPQDVSNDLVNGVQKQTGEIKSTLQQVKQTLKTTSNSSDKDLSKEVALAKDLVKQVDVNNVDVAITGHLNGSSSITKADVVNIVSSTLNSAVAEVGSTQQDVEGVKTIVHALKTELDKEVASSTKNGYNISSTSTKELSEQVSTAAIETTQASNETKVASAEVDKRVVETKEMLTNGDLNGVINSLKGVNDASKEVEKISQASLEKVQSVLPIVQVIKNQDIASGGALNINSVQIASSSISLVLSSTSTSASSTTSTTPTSSVSSTITSSLKNNVIKNTTTTTVVVPVVTTTLIIKK